MAQEILVVDDEEMLRDLIALEFQSKGYQTFRAAGGEEALEILRQNPGIELVLSDIRMPKMNGIELLNKIKDEAHYDKPLVMLMTGYSDYTLDTIYELGADGLFEKPFDRVHLFDAVSRSLLPKQIRWSQKRNQAFPGSLTLTDLDYQTLSFGRGGVFVPLDANFPSIGSEIKFTWGTGIVRWLRTFIQKDLPAGLGVEISYIDSDYMDRIIAHIDSKHTKVFIPGS